MQDDLPEIRLDSDKLYREETFTDRRAGILRRLTPVTRDGADDASRPVLFLGQAQLMTQLGTLPISFEIEASTLAEALEKYPAAAKQGIQETVEEIQQMRREAASSIVLPGQGGVGGMPPGGVPGGGIKLR